MSNDSQRKSIVLIDEDYYEYIVCILLLLLVPLLPLGIEFMRLNQTITESSLTITTAMYCLTLGFSSRNVVIFITSLIAGFVCGVTPISYEKVSNEEFWTTQRTLCIVLIGLTFLIHAIERYNRHVVGRELFLALKLNNRKGVE